MHEEIQGSEFVRPAVRIPSSVRGPTLPSRRRCLLDSLTLQSCQELREQDCLCIFRKGQHEAEI